MGKFDREIKMLEKIREDYDTQLRKADYGSKKYNELKETRNEAIERMFSLVYKNTD